MASLKLVTWTCYYGLSPFSPLHRIISGINQYFRSHTHTLPDISMNWGRKLLLQLLKGFSFFFFFVGAGSAEKLFNLCDDYADSTKKRVHIWPLQNAALILCPVSKVSLGKVP